MKAIGEIIRCTAKEYFYGKMAEDTRVNTLMIKNMDMGNSFGQTAESIKVIGKMVNNMEEEFIRELLEFREKENGEMAKKLDGSMNENNIGDLKYNEF